MIQIKIITIEMITYKINEFKIIDFEMIVNQFFKIFGNPVLYIILKYENFYTFVLHTRWFLENLQHACAFNYTNTFCPSWKTVVGNQNLNKSPSLFDVAKYIAISF